MRRKVYRKEPWLMKHTWPNSGVSTKMYMVRNNVPAPAVVEQVLFLHPFA